MAKISQDTPRSDLEWVKLREEMAAVEPERDGLLQSMIKIFKQNPLIPAGVIATSTALILGLRAFQKGDTKRSNSMMRFRILFQTITVAAVTTSVYLTAKARARKQNPE